MEENKISIKLPNGDSLVAEICPYDGGQIAVGILHDDVWIQDLAVVETDSKDGKYIENKFNVYVFGNEYEEGYTECFGINRIPSDSL